MAQWSANDEANGAVLWAPAKYKTAPNTANRDALYLNATADAWVTGQTIGMYGVDSNEIAVGSLTLTGVVLSEDGTEGSYAPGEPLTLDQTGATYVTAANLEVVTTKIREANVAVNEPGGDYANGDLVTTFDGQGTGAIFEVTTGASDTNVASVALANSGVGTAGSYTGNPSLTNAATANVTGLGTGLTLDLEMEIDTISVTSAGEYSVAPTTLIDNTLAGSASGNGATANLTFTTGGAGKIAHTGWITRTVGSGGRAGRIQTEVLVAGGIITDNDDDDTIFPDA